MTEQLMDDLTNEQHEALLPLWVTALMIFDSTPGPDYVAMCAVLERIADEIETRGDKGLDLDQGETSDWLREEANVTKAAKDYHDRSTPMSELSPATQAVLTAFRERYTEALRPGPFPDYWQEACLAAALTALAVRIKSADGIRQDVLDIVNELEAVGLYDND